AFAMLASFIVVAVYDRRFTPADNQAMGGMIAGGEMMLGVAVFLLVSLVPTAYALWSLRRNRSAWAAVSIAGIGFAAFGLARVVTTLATHRLTSPSLPLELIGLLGLAQMLGSPLWIGGFGLFALLAPERDLRRRFLAAVALEVIVGACSLVHFLPAWGN